MKYLKCIKSLRIYILIIITTLISGCNDMALMHPKGQIGIEQRSLILTALGLMLIIVIPVIIMTFIFAIRYRASNIHATYSPNWHYSTKIEMIIWTVPIFIIIFLAEITLKSTYALDPNKPINPNISPIIIEVIALDWKWLFIYPKQGIATINEIAFPINTPINFKITSNSVMNSFFIPRLGSQIYAMAGMSSKLNLIANEPGLYKGISSNFSGQGFSGMKFNVIAMLNEEEFNDWIKKIRLSQDNINNIDNYEKLAIPSMFHPIQYFSNVKPNLYQDIINKFIE